MLGPDPIEPPRLQAHRLQFKDTMTPNKHEMRGILQDCRLAWSLSKIKVIKKKEKSKLKKVTRPTTKCDM